MENAYEILKKYAKILSQQEYPAGKGACLVIDTETGLWATREGADFANLKMGDVHASPYKFIPDKQKAMVISRTPYCTLVQSMKESLKPSVDDMAQIIGPACVRLRKMPKKMAGCAGAFIAPKNEKPFTVTTGRSLYEAVTALTVLEKSAEIRVRTEQIGGAKYINPAEAALMRTIYLKKYSKKEEEVKTKEEAGITSETKEIPDIEERAEILQAETFKEKERELSHIRHDIRRKLITLKELTGGDGTDPVCKIIQEIDEELAKTKSRIFCNNAHVNAILTMYHRQAESLGIDCDMLVDVPEDFKLDVVEFSVMLSNLLRNAIDGCKNVPEEVFSFINLQARTSKKAFILEIKSSDIKEASKDLQIENYVNKYNGLYELMTEDGVSITKILINIY